MYAIGEIFLVVIGILIALYLNNLNEERKLRQQELKILNDIRLNLIDSRAEIALSLRNNSLNIEQYRKFALIVENDQPYTEELDSIFGILPYWSTPYLSYTAYQTLRTVGLDMITNQDLKNKIVFLYENHFAYLTNDWDKWEWNINQDITMPFFSKHIEGSMTDRNVARPNDFEALKDNDEFRNLLGVLFRTRIYGVTWSETVMDYLDLLVADIETELVERGYGLQES